MPNPYVPIGDTLKRAGDILRQERERVRETASTLEAERTASEKLDREESD